MYRFRADQAGTYWYHTHEVSARGVKLGLYGTLVVHPTGTAAGRGRPDAADAHASTGPSTRRPRRPRRPGRDAGPAAAGQHGRHPPLVQVVGTPFRVVAVDGSDLNQPGQVRDVGLLIPAGGRYDVAFTMPAGGVVAAVPRPPAGRAVARPTGAGRTAADWPVLDLLSYGTPAAVPFDVRIALRPAVHPGPRPGLALVDGRPAYAYTVNGTPYPDIPTEVVRPATWSSSPSSTGRSRCTRGTCTGTGCWSWPGTGWRRPAVHFGWTRSTCAPARYGGSRSGPTTPGSG